MENATSPPTSDDNRLYGFLEGRPFRWIIDYTIHPLHITALLLLWIGLLVFHGTVFELVGGNPPPDPTLPPFAVATASPL